MMVTLWQRVVRRTKRILDLEDRHRFYKVKAAPLPDRHFAGPHGHSLYASAFNPAWFDELGVEPTCIIDVGSFDGGDALRLKEFAKEAKVITIEADPDRAIQVRDALAGTAIEVVECAIHASDDDAHLYRTRIDGAPSSQGSLYQFDEKSKVDLSYIVQDTAPISVTGRSLSSLAVQLGIQGISLLHMDIQGAEYDAILGMGRLRPSIIYLEVNAHYKGIKGAKSVHRLLTKMGYELAGDFISDRLYFRKTT